MRAWRVHRYGRPSEALELDDIDPPKPGPGQLLVRARSTVLNFNDVDGCYGRYLTIHPPLPYTLGMEVVGDVEAAGPGAEAWIGRRVISTAVGATGAYAEQVLVSTHCFEAPEALDDREAAAFGSFPFHLSHVALHERGQLQAGETLLVHSGAGGIGSAAIQVGVAAGARVFATAGGPEKVKFCRQLGAEVAIDYRSEDFVEAVLQATDGKGVDVICDLVWGEIGERSWDCIARNGRHLILGFSSGIEAEDAPMPPPRKMMFGNFSLAGVLLSYPDDDARKAVHGHLLELLAEGRIRPIVGQTVSFSDLPEALEALEQRKTIGRTVVML